LSHRSIGLNCFTADDAKFSRRILGVIDKLGPLLAMLGVWALFAALQWKTFATWENTQSILLQTAVVGVAALGATMIIISGGIDLSVGSLIALVSVVVALVLKSASASATAAADAASTSGVSPTAAMILAVLAALAVAVLCGLA